MPLPNSILKKLEDAFAASNKSLLKAENARLSLNYQLKGADRHRLHIDTARKRLAYLASRFPATYSVCETVLEKLTQTDLSFETSLDLGAGPGTATICAAHLFPEMQTRTLIDQDKEFRAFALSFLPSGQNEYLLKNLATETNSALPKRDLTLISYALNELEIDHASQLVHQAWLATKKALVIIEPGTPECFVRLKRLRIELINYGAYLLAPCPHEKDCPLTGEDWCHFSKRLERTPLHKFIKNASLGYEDEKYSYLIALKTHVEERPSCRVIKRPLKRSGHVTFDLCTENGLERLTLSKKNKDLYKASLKYNWGDGFDIEKTTGEDL